MLTLTMFSVLTRCLGFLYKIYLSRIMTTTELGIYNQTLSIYMVLITIVSSSIPLTISKITSLNKSNNKQYLTNYSVTSSLILSTALSIVLCMMIIVLKPLIIMLLGNVEGYNIMITLIPSVIFTALYSQIRGYLWGLENYFAVSIVEFFEQILRIAFCMIFITLNIFSSPILAVGIALSIACGISTVYGFILYFKNGGRLKYRQGYYKDIIRSSAPLTGVRIFSSLLQPIVAVVLPLQLTRYGLDTSTALSELGIIMGMSMPLLSIPSTIIGALCMILIPRISSQESNKDHIAKQINNYIKFSILCVFLFIPIFITLGVPICNFVFNNLNAGVYLSYSAWIIIPMGIAQITTSILNALNQEQKTFIYFIISNILMLFIVLTTTKFFGIKSMVIGIGLSNSILSIFNLIKIKKLTGFKPNIIPTLTYHLLLNLPIIAIVKLVYNILTKSINVFFCIAISSIISVLSYIALCFVFNILDFNLFKSFVSHLNHNQNKTNIKKG